MAEVVDQNEELNWMQARNASLAATGGDDVGEDVDIVPLEAAAMSE